VTQEHTIHFKSETLPTFAERGFVPILETFCRPLADCDLEPIDAVEGKSITLLSEGIDSPFLKGFFKCYRMDRCEKICLCNCILMDRILTSALIVIPHDDYELHMLILEWSETEDTISVVVDLIPLVDLVMREDYRETYLAPLDQYWTKYKSLPGMVPNRFVWSRMMFSPYYLSGAMSKENGEHKRDCLDIMKSYLGVWMNQWENAAPIEDSQTKRYVKERKTRIRQIFRANDEGAKSMAQMVGQDVIDVLLLCSF
jgi:hypothetical protein